MFGQGLKLVGSSAGLLTTGYLLGSREWSTSPKSDFFAPFVLNAAVNETQLVVSNFQTLKRPNESLLCPGHYAVVYNNRLRIPTLVMEILDKDSLAGTKQARPPKFFADKHIHDFFRVYHEDYRGSGYTRGHMAAAHNHRLSVDQYNASFLMTNVAPQICDGFNDLSGLWTRLEHYTVKTTRKKSVKKVVVFSGPLFVPTKVNAADPNSKRYVSYEVIGSKDVAVPTHYFKVLFIEKLDRPGVYHCEAYLAEHRKYLDAPKENLQNYRVPLDAIERASGYVFRHAPVAMLGIECGPVQATS